MAGAELVIHGSNVPHELDAAGRAGSPWQGSCAPLSEGRQRMNAFATMRLAAPSTGVAAVATVVCTRVAVAGGAPLEEAGGHGQARA